MRLGNALIVPGSSKRMGMPLWEYKDTGARELDVRAESELFLLLDASKFSGASVYSCAVPVAVSLEEGRDYEMVFHWPSNNTCVVEMSEIVETSVGHERAKRTVFPNYGTKGCVEVFKTWRFI
jgi:hypothetical protein